MVTVKHFIYGFILLNSTSFLKCEDDDDSVEEEESILVRGTFDDISSHDVFFLSFITFLVVSSFIIGSAMTCFIQYLTEQINLHILDKKEEESDRTCSGSRTRTTSETTVTGSSSLTVNSIEENDTIDVPLTQEQEEFIANKRETEREWEQETKYSNQGSVTMRSQNVEILDLVDGLELRTPPKNSIVEVKWEDGTIAFYEIGEDIDEFQATDDGRGLLSSSSIMTASIKRA